MNSDKPARILEPISLEDGIVPISRAASSLAALIKQARASKKPIVVTQKGYPAGIILSIEVFTELRELVEAQQRAADLHD